MVVTTLWGKIRNRPNAFDVLFLEHAKISLRCAPVLKRFFEGEKAALSEITSLEHEGDAVARNVFRLLARTTFIPYEDELIKSLIRELDNVLDEGRSAARKLAGFQLTEVNPTASMLCELIQKSIAIIVIVLETMPSFSREVIDKALIEINDLEERADVLREETMSALFAGTADNDPITKQQHAWERIIHDLESVTDHCMHVINVIDSMARRKSV